MTEYDSFSSIKSKQKKFAIERQRKIDAQKRQMLYQLDKFVPGSKNNLQDQMTTMKKRKGEYVPLYSYIEACSKVPSEMRQVMSGLTSNRRDTVVIDIDKTYTEELSNTLIEQLRRLTGYKPNIITINEKGLDGKPGTQHFQYCYLLDKPFKGNGETWAEDTSGERIRYIVTYKFLNQVVGDGRFTGGFIKNPVGGIGLKHMILNKEPVSKDRFMSNLAIYIDPILNERLDYASKQKKAVRKERKSRVVERVIDINEKRIRQELLRYGVTSADIRDIEMKIDDWSSRNCAALIACNSLGLRVYRKTGMIDRRFCELVVTLFEKISLSYNKKSSVEDLLSISNTALGCLSFIKSVYDDSLVKESAKFDEANRIESLRTRQYDKYAKSLYIKGLQAQGKSKKEILSILEIKNNSSTVWRDAKEYDVPFLVDKIKERIDELKSSYEFSSYSKKEKIISQLFYYINTIRKVNNVLRLGLGSFIALTLNWIKSRANVEVIKSEKISIPVEYRTLKVESYEKENRMKIKRFNRESLPRADTIIHIRQVAGGVP